MVHIKVFESYARAMAFAHGRIRAGKRVKVVRTPKGRWEARSGP